jgi:hypothetical protein
MTVAAVVGNSRSGAPVPRCNRGGGASAGDVEVGGVVLLVFSEWRR